MEDCYRTSEEFEKRVHKDAIDAEGYYGLREKFEGWGFLSVENKYIQNLIDESGYFVWAFQKEDGTWTVSVTPKSDGKFDPARAHKTLDTIDARRDLGEWSLNRANKDVLTLADQLCAAARSSLEKHGDFRDAVKAMADYELRDRSHPNASKRDDLRRILHLYVSAREQYKGDLDSHTGWTVDDASWFDDRIKQFRYVAWVYVNTPNAHTRRLTSEISEWLLRPYADRLALGAGWHFPQSRIGAEWKKPWCIIVPLCISILLFALSVALVIGCYLFLTPTASYGAAGLCGLFFARRYVQAVEFRKERGKLARLWRKVSDLKEEVKNGTYNVGEVITRFRELEVDDISLPSIFVSVIALNEAQPDKQPADEGRLSGLSDTSETLRGIVSRIDSLSAMVEFVGEQSFTNFANRVNSFKDAQKEELRKKAQQDTEEQRFKEIIDARVRITRVEREKEANAAREAFRRSHQTKQKGP